MLHGTLADGLCGRRLSDLVLTGNRFVSLDLSTSPVGIGATSTPTASPPLHKLERLSLVDNLLSSFSDSIDALASAAPITFPSLRRLLLAGNPLLSRENTSATATITAPADYSEDPLARAAHTLDRDALHARLLVLARMPFLSELEGSPVVPAECDDAGRFWLERLRDGEKGEARDMHEQLGACVRERVQQLRKSASAPSLLLCVSISPTFRLSHLQSIPNSTRQRMRMRAAKAQSRRKRGSSRA